MLDGHAPLDMTVQEIAPALIGAGRLDHLSIRDRLLPDERVLARKWREI